MDEGADRIANRLAWITGLRLAFLALLLGGTAVFNLHEVSLGESQVVVIATIGAAFALAAVYATWLRSRWRLKRLAEVQIVLDQLTWTAIVYVSGGATSGATSFYGLTCLVGAILIGLRGAALAAVVGIGVFGAMCAAFGFGWIHQPADQMAVNYPVTWEAMNYPLLVNVLGIVVVALLAGYLADRLRRTGGQLVEAQERMLAAERLAVLGRLAAGLAHEIRNPLGSISGSIEMLREAPGLGEEDRRLCDIVHREAARLNHLITDMMDLAKPRPPEPAPVDVAALAREVVELASRSERSAVDVSVTYRGPDTAVWALCDGQQMRQVLWNLVRNGVEASAGGSSVEVGVKTEGSRVELTVSDEGPGIAPDAVAKIFDAFYTTRTKGTGIGLAVVKRIIDDHASFGATLGVRNKTAPGATFEVGLRQVAPVDLRTDDARSPSDSPALASVNARSRSAET